MTRRQLCKVQKGEMVSGVCMGFSHYFNIDVSIIRLIFVAMLILGVGSLVLIYFVLAIILPTADPDDWDYVEVEDDEDDFYEPTRKSSYREEDVEAYGYAPEDEKDTKERY